MSWFLSSEKFLDECHDYAWLPNLFSNDEIDKIIKIGCNKKIQKGTTASGNESSEKIRKNKVSWIDPDDESEWLFRKLTDAVVEINKDIFWFYFGWFFLSQIQFTIYNE